MEKDFDRCNRHKKKVNDAADRPFYHAREIWWCAVGVNVGNELDGTGKEHDRPVLVIRPFNAETFFGLALIGHPRVGRYYFPLGKVDDREAVANPHKRACSIRSVSSARLVWWINGRFANSLRRSH